MRSCSCAFHYFHHLTPFNEKPLYYGASFVGLSIGYLINARRWDAFREDYILQQIENKRQGQRARVKA